MSIKFWMIVNDANSDESSEYDGFIVPQKDAPRFQHLNREKAERELLRLAMKYGQGKFVLLEAVAAWVFQ